MTNDAKLGMLAGVLGVIAAAALFTGAPPPAAQSQPVASESPAKPKLAPAVATVAPPRSGSDAPASTPVARTRKEAQGQSTSRSAGADEEP